MALLNKPNFCIYEKVHSVQTIPFEQLNQVESRNLTITLTDFGEVLQIKARDGNDLLFNYTTNIDVRHFEQMRHEQNLDIDFTEFRANLIDLLQQTQRNDMFLKLSKTSATDDNSLLTFYSKSRIKSIVYLVVALKATDQREIFDEINCNLLELHNSNRHLKSNINDLKTALVDCNQQLEQAKCNRDLLQERFKNEISIIEQALNRSCALFHRNIVEKLCQLDDRLQTVKGQLPSVRCRVVSLRHCHLSQKNSIVDLRKELVQASDTIRSIRMDNTELRTKLDTCQRQFDDVLMANKGLESKLGEGGRLYQSLEMDMKQATLIIAQKTAANDELAQDLVQANQMIVNFNNLYDKKTNEIDDLTNTLTNKEEILQEQRKHMEEVRREFEEYRKRYNDEEYQRVRHELFVGQEKFEQLDKAHREALKLNELLTRKLATFN